MPTVEESIQNRYPPIRVRHLCYVVLPIEGNGVWQKNLDQLKPHLPLFNGRRRVGILTGEDTEKLRLDLPSSVERYLGLKQIEYVRIPNNPDLREVAAWVPLLEPLAQAKEDEAIFWGHAKAVTHGDVGTCWRWAKLLYAINLRSYDLVEPLTRRFPIAGAFMRSPLEVFAHRPTNSTFEFHGGFYWLRAAELFRRKWREIEQNWTGTETAPGVLFRPEEAGMVFPTKEIGIRMSLYHEHDMRKAEDDFAAFEKPQQEQTLPTAIQPGKYPPIKKRHLVYTVLPVAKNGVWQLNLDQLIPYLRHFNGRKRVAILTGSPGTQYPLDPPEAVKAYLVGHGCEFVTKANNPKMREGEVWRELFEPLQGAGEDESVFYSHAKGVTRDSSSGAHHWASLMYRACLGTLPLADEMLTRFPICGALKHVGVNFLKTPSKWQYVGSFYWVRLAEMFRRDWKKLDLNWGAVETWPGLHYSIEEGGAIWPEQPISDGKLYQPEYWDAMERAFAVWRSNLPNYQEENPMIDPEGSLSSLVTTGRYSTDKEGRHAYCSGFYDKEFSRISGRPIRLLEVGVKTGGSLKLWADYFPGSEIIGVDLNLGLMERDVASSDRIKVHRANGYDPAFAAKAGELDIAIDDGDHTLANQVKFVQLYWPKIRHGGWLIVEDVQDPAHFERLRMALPEAVRGRAMCVDLRTKRGRYDDLLFAVER